MPEHALEGKPPHIMLGRLAPPAWRGWLEKLRRPAMRPTARVRGVGAADRNRCLAVAQVILAKDSREFAFRPRRPYSDQPSSRRQKNDKVRVAHP